MMFFFCDESLESKITFEKFYSDLLSKNKIAKFVCFKKTYEVILELSAAIFYGKDIVLLDGDFTETELKNLGVSQNDLSDKWVIDTVLPNINKDIFRENILSNQDMVKIGIFTSGTTGKPKCVQHTLYSLMRNVKIGEKHSSDIWGLAYNVTHYAGVQVVLQALLNNNTIIDLFGKNSNNADTLLDKYGCTCISATPTYFRNYIFPANNKNTKIKSITFGGEKFSNDLLENTKRKFPNARVRNIYASTEVGSILSGNGEFFVIPSNLKEKVKISEENHLLIHTSLLGGIEVDGDWYDTKDIVSINNDGTFKFLSRNTDFINVGGYKVNLIEVEEEILKVEGIIDVAVYGRDNSVTGKILVADVVVSEGYESKKVKNSISTYLKSNLQSFKIPRIINIVAELKKNRTGKKVR